MRTLPVTTARDCWGAFVVANDYGFVRLRRPERRRLCRM